MAINKRKVLESARKIAQKGAKEKALKEYAKLLKADPKDAKLRLEIGDHHRRWGQLDEAIAAYNKVAEQYTSDGFDARAVAVYKQILNLDTKRYAAHVALSELYQRMGLNSEAANALQMAAEGYQQQGKKREALELLRKMASLDPSNTTSRLKVAELLSQEELYEDALNEYAEVASELERQGEAEQLAKVYGQILEISPDQTKTLSALAKLLVDRGRSDRAEPFAARAIDAEPKTRGHYELLVDIYRDQQREDKAAEVYARLADMLEECGQDEEAREIRQRFASVDSLGTSGDGDGEGLFGSDDIGLGEDPGAGNEFGDELELGEPLGDDDSVALEEAAPLEGEEDDALELDPSSALPPVQDEPPKPTAKPKPKGDPEQLLAEASVYLRYGKRERAIENLEAVLADDPDHRAALEKLGEAHAEGNDSAESVRVWLRAVELARSEGDARAVDILRDRIAALDENAAAGIAPLEDASADEDAVADGTGAELAIDDEEDEPEVETPAPEIEPDIDIASDEPEVKLAEGPEAGEGLAIDDSEDPKIEIDISGEEPEAASPSQSQDVLEKLEEADFYMEQGLHDEAEEIYRRVLERAPNHPQVLLRLGEIAAARGGDPNAGTDPEGEGAGAPEMSVEVDVDADDDNASSGGDIETWTDELSESADIGVDSEQPGDTAVGIDLDVEPDVEARAAEPKIAVAIDDVEEEAAPPPVKASKPEKTAEPKVAPKIEKAPKRAADPGASFDLAAALADVFEDDGKPASQSGTATTEEGFSAVFQAFKEGVRHTLTEEDFETRYDLAIAYREMGLLDDAINEFRTCLESPARHLASLNMLGLCALDLGRAADAVSHFEQALALPDVTEDQRTAMRFDLGRAFQAQGDRRRAREAFEMVASADMNFRDVAEHLAALEGESDDAEPEGSAEPEAFESFDDVIADVVGVDEAPPDESSPPQKKPKKKGGGGGGGRKKKKISFV